MITDAEGKSFEYDKSLQALWRVSGISLDKLSLELTSVLKANDL